MPIYHFPNDLEQIISARAREDAGDGDPRALADAIRRLSDLFNGKAPWDSDYARERPLRRAYLEYYLPVNLPKIRLPLSKWIAERPDRFAGRPLRCLDLGSGPGSALLGLCDFIRDLPEPKRPTELDLAAIDISPENLREAERLLRAFGEAEPRLPPVRFRAFRLDLVKERSGLFPLARAGGRYDLVVAANVICELAREGPDGLGRACDLVRTAAAEILDPEGAIVLVEPGLRDTARDLHRLRDRVLETTEGLFIHAPCLHHAACPALFSERDWCIADMEWTPPAMVAELDRRTGLRKGSLKFAYLVLSPLAPVRREEAPLPRRWRVVSDVLDLKGERRVYLCAAGRWIVLGHLKREGGPNEEVLRALARGDLVEVEGIEEQAGPILRLSGGGRIRRIAEELSAPERSA